MEDETALRLADEDCAQALLDMWELRRANHMPKVTAALDRMLREWLLIRAIGEPGGG